MWSSVGNIDAGASSRTVQSAPPTRVLVDSQSANVQTDLAGLATGGGIGVLETVIGAPPGNVDLSRPSAPLTRATRHAHRATSTWPRHRCSMPATFRPEAAAPAFLRQPQHRISAARSRLPVPPALPRTLRPKPPDNNSPTTNHKRKSRPPSSPSRSSATAEATTVLARTSAPTGILRRLPTLFPARNTGSAGFCWSSICAPL